MEDVHSLLTDVPPPSGIVTTYFSNSCCRLQNDKVGLVLLKITLKVPRELTILLFLKIFRLDYEFVGSRLMKVEWRIN